MLVCSNRWYNDSSSLRPLQDGGFFIVTLRHMQITLFTYGIRLKFVLLCSGTCFALELACKERLVHKEVNE